MKKSFLIIASLFLLTLIYSACNNQDKKENTTEQMQTGEATYACPMHPEVTSDKPGTCSKCGMDLEKVQGNKDADHHEHSDSTGHETHDH